MENRTQKVSEKLPFENRMVRFSDIDITNLSIMSQWHCVEHQQKNSSCLDLIKKFKSFITSNSFCLKSRNFTYSNWAVKIIFNFSETQIWSDISIAVPFTQKKSYPLWESACQKLLKSQSTKFNCVSVKESHLFMHSWDHSRIHPLLSRAPSKTQMNSSPIHL
jgi:hypothetical protein